MNSKKELLIKITRDNSNIKVDINTEAEMLPVFAADLIIRSAIERNISIASVLEETKEYIVKEKEYAIRSRTDNESNESIK